MANKKISQLTAKAADLAATDLVEISESDGVGGYVTKSVTGANVLSSKQDTLVSGTNIKSINSNTLLGSGDLVIGSGPHVLNKPVSGRTYSVRLDSAQTSINVAVPLTSNTFALTPFIPANTLTVSNLQINVTTSTPSSNARILIYSNVDGSPVTKLLESTNLDCSTNGVKTYTASFTFNAGTTYWLGVFTSLSVSFSAVSGQQLIPISSNAFSGGFPAVQVTATFPTSPTTISTFSLAGAGLNLPLINLTAV